MRHGTSSAANGGIRSFIFLAGAAAGCALAAGVAALWLNLTGGGPAGWTVLAPPAAFGALSGWLLARLIPRRQPRETVWLRLCMHCHAVNADPDLARAPSGWQNVDRYLEDNLGVEVSHGVCPQCLRQHYGQPVLEKQASPACLHAHS